MKKLEVRDYILLGEDFKLTRSEGHYSASQRVQPVIP
jgi:hypothetical protein